jgi:hypothetical protein
MMACVRGFMPADATIIHSLGGIATAPTTAWEVEQVGQPTIMAVDQAQNAATGGAWRAFESRAVILFKDVQPTIQTQLLSHQFEIFSQSGAATTGVGDLLFTMAMRSILSGRELENYDPVR